MVEAAAAARIPGCREAVEKLRVEDVVDALRRLMSVEKVAVKGSRVELTYLYTPDEFTRKRLRVKLEVERGEGRLVARGKGSLGLELVVECSGDEAAVALTVYKGEKYIGKEMLEDVVKSIVERLKSLAPQPPAPPAPAPAAPAAATPAAERGGELPCTVRLITAGLPVDEALSRRIPGEIHDHANVAGRVVEEGEAPSDLLDLSMYRDGYDVRLAWGENMLESYRAGGRVGVYMRSPTGESYGEAAVAQASRELCRGRIRVFYMVIRV